MSEYCYKYPRPSLTTDVLLIGIEDKSIKILLIQRKNPPFKDFWALPGGFVDENETVENCAVRELKEETDLENENLALLAVMSQPNRDPRGRTVSVVFWKIIKGFPLAKAQDDAKNVNWFDIEKIPDLAFDHKEILKIAFDKILNSKFDEEFYDKNLTINEIENLKEAVKNLQIDF